MSYTLDYSIDPAEVASLLGGASANTNATPPYAGTVSSPASASVWDWVNNGLSSYALFQQIRNGTNTAAGAQESPGQPIVTGSGASSQGVSRAVVLGGLALVGVVAAVLLLRK